MSIFIDSLKKSKILRETSLIVTKMKKGDINLAYKQFYNFISNYPVFVPNSPRKFNLRRI